LRWSRAGRGACHEHGVVLQFGGYAHERRADFADDLADLRYAERPAPLSERDFGDVAARRERDLPLQLTGDAQLLPHASNVDSGSAAADGIGVNHDLRAKQGALEILNRSDARYRVARGHDGADAGGADRDLAAGVDSSLLHESGHRQGRPDDQISGLA